MRPCLLGAIEGPVRLDGSGGDDFEPREEALGAWQEVKGEAMTCAIKRASVNEALYGGAIEGPVRLDGS